MTNKGIRFMTIVLVGRMELVSPIQYTVCTSVGIFRHKMYIKF